MFVMRTIVLFGLVVAGSENAVGGEYGVECERVRAEACSYYQYEAAKSVEDFRAALTVCVESSRDTTDKYGLDTGAEYYKACRASLQGMVDRTNDRLLEYSGCVSRFVCAE